jgi:hypothetical protein
VGSNPGTVYWLDVCDASCYIHEITKIKAAEWGTPKKKKKKRLEGQVGQRGEDRQVRQVKHGKSIRQEGQIRQVKKVRQERKTFSANLLKGFLFFVKTKT